MGITIQTGLTSVTGTVTSTEQKRTAITVSDDITANATTTVGTVPASKVWRILSVSISLYVNGANSGSVLMQLEGVQVAKCALTGDAATSSLVDRQTITWNYASAPVLVATDIIEIISASAVGRGTYSYSYIEEDA